MAMKSDTAALPSPAPAPEQLPAPRPDVDALVRRFDPARRRTIRRLVQSSARAADLAAVFPGAIYAMAIRRGPATRRRRALDLVEQGAPLREVTHTLELPMWLRRLPPEAFAGPLGAVPASEMFSRRIVNHLPLRPAESALWLKSVIFAARACDEYFALWLASQPVFNESGDPERVFGLLAAYAWFSSAEISRGRTLIVAPWRPEMALDTAVCAAKSWFNRLRLVLQVRDGALADSWLEPGEAMGLSFVPLLDHADILAEAHAMLNCADQYADRLMRDKCRLFGVRRRGTRIATLEIGPHPREPGVLAISQLKARHNMPAASDVWQAAHAWLSSQKNLRRPPAIRTAAQSMHAATWESLMAGYRARKRGAPWIPLVANPATFARIDEDMADLARRAGISSWLFT